MIYEISANDVDYCIANQCHCICISNDMSTALVTSIKALDDIQVVNEYHHTEINELMSLEKWKQFCKDCS